MDAPGGGGGQNQMMNGGDQLEQPSDVIPSQMEPIGEPNAPVDQNILRDLHQNLTIDNIHLSTNYPAILDDKSLAGQSPIYCHCDSYNSEFHKNTN